jgi:predicted kinase
MTAALATIVAPIATGKSSLAGALTRNLLIPTISSDATRKTLAGLRPSDPGSPALSSEASTHNTYSEMNRRASSVIDSDRGVILDGTFGKHSLRTALRDLARSHDRPFLFVEVTCDEPTLRHRLAQRQLTAGESDARIGDLPAIRRLYERPDELAPHERLVLNGARPLEELVDAVRTRIARSP